MCDGFRGLMREGVEPVTSYSTRVMRSVQSCSRSKPVAVVGGVFRFLAFSIESIAFVAVSRIRASTNTRSSRSRPRRSPKAATAASRLSAMSRRHAAELLRGDHVGGGTGRVKVSTSQKLPDVIAADVDDAKLLEQVVGYYADTLKRTPSAIDFLQQSGVTAEAVEKLRIGVSDRTLGYRIPKGNRKAGSEIRGRLQRLGLLRESGHESLRGCITVPLVDEHGVIVSVYGRRLDARVVESPGLYAGTKGIFNIEAIKASRQTFVCLDHLMDIHPGRQEHPKDLGLRIREPLLELVRPVLPFIRSRKADRHLGDAVLHDGGHQLVQVVVVDGRDGVNAVAPHDQGVEDRRARRHRRPWPR